MKNKEKKRKKSRALLCTDSKLNVCLMKTQPERKHNPKKKRRLRKRKKRRRRRKEMKMMRKMRSQRKKPRRTKRKAKSNDDASNTYEYFLS